MTEAPAASASEPSATAAALSSDAPGFACHTKRRFALMFGYVGTAYRGLQIQKEQELRTVEGALETAIVGTGVIKPDNAGDLRKSAWNRASRTDKGVHAFGQVVSLRAGISPDRESVEAFRVRLNELLPADIHVFQVLRTPKSFDSKRACNGRRYEYLVPTFMLVPPPVDAPNLDPDDLSHAMRLEKLDRRRANAAAEAEDEEDDDDDDGENGDGGDDDDDDDSVNSSKEQRRRKREREESATAAGATQDSAEDLARVAEVRERYKKYLTPSASESPERITTAPKLSEEKRAALDAALALFVGSHCYHNFTPRMAGDDPSARRYITHCATDPPFNVAGIEVVRINIEGQSFMLNQIRKMVAAAVETTRRGLDPRKVIPPLLDPRVSAHIVMAPGEGLALRAVLYDSYNAKFPARGAAVAQQSAVEYDAIDFAHGPSAEEVERFRQEQVYPAMLRQERERQVFTEWMHYSDIRAFPPRPQAVTRRFKDYAKKRRKDQEDYKKKRFGNRARAAKGTAEALQEEVKSFIDEKQPRSDAADTVMKKEGF